MGRQLPNGLQVRHMGLAVVLLGGLIAIGADQLGQPRRQSVAAAATRSDTVVKVDATAGTSADGQQVIRVTLAIDKDYHIYANPAGDENVIATTVTVKGANEATTAIASYPAGRLSEHGYKYYEDKVVIPATVQRAAGDTGPLEVSIRFQACDKRSCLPPVTVKRTVP